MEHVGIAPVPIDSIGSIIGQKALTRLKQMVPDAKRLLEDRLIWNVNSTAQGGGVAEMLQPILSYVRGLGLDVRWLVIGGNPEFFDITKRIHNQIHGVPGDGGALGPEQRKAYEAVAAMNAQSFAEHARPGDIVICHDPQTAGLIPWLRERGCLTVWRCHIGHDQPNKWSMAAWEFLAPYLRLADRHVFTRWSYVPPQLDRDNVDIIPPSIDPLSVKNQYLSRKTVRAILTAAGILHNGANSAEPHYTRQDGSIGIVHRTADMVRVGEPLRPNQRLVLQVSRWDYLKDPIGVMNGFAKYLEDPSAVLMLAGPSVAAVADDPEGGKVLSEVIDAWKALPDVMRARVQLACLPMVDRQENAAIVNALQRHATIVVQKSLHEGFGLTVTEAMWKSRPMVASAVGGIQDQIEDGIHGLLVRDPHDLRAFAGALDSILGDPQLASRLRRNARNRVKREFLLSRHLRQYDELLRKLLTTTATVDPKRRRAG